MEAVLEREVRDMRPRDAARAQWRRARAVELALDGKSYDFIAREIGVSSRGNAWRTVQKALNDRVVAGVDELRELECDRLDALQVAAWAKVEQGDLKAIETVLRIMDRRARLLGLYPTKTKTQPEYVSIVRPGAGATG